VYPIVQPVAAEKRPSRFRRFLAPLATLAFVVVVAAILSGAPASGASASVSFVQGATFDTGKLASTAVALTKPVQAGDLLVGWFAQYAVAGHVQVSDNVNGAWTRASGSEQFGGNNGDIALYYLAGSKAAAGGLTITVSASAAAYLQGTVAEYSGVATSGPLLAMAVARGSGTAVNSGATSSIPAGQLVYAAEVTGVSPGAVPTPGSSAGIAYTERASTSSSSAFEEDITSSAAGPQQGTATLNASTDWYAVVAAFQVTCAASSPSPTPTTSSPTPTPTPTSSGTPPPGSVSYAQGNWFSTPPVTSTTVSLTQPVQAGDLLVGWFAQYGAPGHVQVSDNVNGAWTRAPTSLAYQDDGGDIALYYLADAKTSVSGLQITVSLRSPRRPRHTWTEPWPSTRESPKPARSTRLSRLGAWEPA
jgi:hypothetical protein